MGRAHDEGLVRVHLHVDDQFQKAGFDEERVVEIHGSIHLVQCTGCDSRVASAAPYSVEVDPDTFRAREPLPRCAACSSLLRPNIPMFGDGGWISTRTDEQEGYLAAWLESLGDARLAVVECGAGTVVPSVRIFCERRMRRGGSLVRINVREPSVPAGAIALSLGALEALRAMDAVLAEGTTRGGR